MLRLMNISRARKENPLDKNMTLKGRSRTQKRTHNKRKANQMVIWSLTKPQSHLLAGSCSTQHLDRANPYASGRKKPTPKPRSNEGPRGMEEYIQILQIPQKQRARHRGVLPALGLD